MTVVGSTFCYYIVHCTCTFIIQQVVQLFKEAGKALKCVPFLLLQPIWVSVGTSHIVLISRSRTTSMLGGDGYCILVVDTADTCSGGAGIGSDSHVY